MKQDVSALSFEDFKKSVLQDYYTALISRECSLLGRREVLTGKAKFGIFGDGKEVPQLAMARAFQEGDFRSGYYRDQTFMMAIGAFSIENFFAGLYANPDINADPTSGGRQMGGHFATHSLDANGNWNDLTKIKNSSSDISCTGGQMPRLVGLAQASKVYRKLNIPNSEYFSHNGNEVAWGTIGNASTSEGIFFEAINAAGVMQIPMVMSVWDDGYGISVPSKYQTTKESISEILKGFQRTDTQNGFEIFTVKGWDYPALIDVYQKAGKIAREQHIPVLIHVTELTQPQGHSTSGSHERYKSPERLQWEKDHDCIAKMRSWILEKNIADTDTVTSLEEQAKQEVLQGKQRAWEQFLAPIIELKKQVITLCDEIPNSSFSDEIHQIIGTLKKNKAPLRRQVFSAARKILALLTQENHPQRGSLKDWINTHLHEAENQLGTHLYSETLKNPIHFQEVTPEFDQDSPLVDGRIVLRDNFDKIFEKHPNTLVFGEDTGNIGDVNQGLEGLQKKYGEVRIFDTGIREASIIGQGIGLAMRGLRPIAEIQYLDYIYYAMYVLADDLATLHYRTVGRQTAPMIIRTRGHRLEGIWHAGSPMGMLLHSLRGVYILVPRNMTKAAGFYNTLLEGDQPALVIECLNGYRSKERLPKNLGEFKTPIGVVEVVKAGSDITVVSYGSTFKIVEQVAEELQKVGIDIELIDVQSLIPFDIHRDILKSIQKTNRLLIIDEDMPGAASAYIMREVLETQGAYMFLDSAPQTLTAKEHRPAFGSDGDYFSKPNAEDIFEKIYSIMHEVNPNKYPDLR